MVQRKDRFSTPWRVVETTDAITVIDAQGLVVSRLQFRVEAHVSNTENMTRDEAREIADRMVAVGAAFAPLSKDTVFEAEAISTQKRAR